MESIEVREALNTAILLGEVARTSHTIELNGIGKVQINSGRAALLSREGEWKRITRENLEQRLDELLQENVEERVKRQIDTFVFS